jgi:hypothetical protein
MNEPTVSGVAMGDDVRCFDGLVPDEVAKAESCADVSYRIYSASDLRTFRPRRADVPSHTRLPATEPPIDRRTVANAIAVGVALSAFLLGSVMVALEGLG